MNTGQWQVSTGGGTRPLWARNGQELFYLAPNGALMSVRVERGTTWTPSTPTELLMTPYTERIHPAATTTCPWTASDF